MCSDAAPSSSSSPPGLGQPAVLGAGPVGQALVDRLIGHGLTPQLLTRSAATLPGATAVAVDATDAAALAQALGQGRVDVLFHSAQPAYHRWSQEFPGLQAAIIEACERADTRLVVVENLYGYGPPRGRAFTESTPMRPTTTKGRVRAELWADLLAAHQAGRVQAVAVRASDFFGPGVEQSAFGRGFLGSIVAGKRAQVLGDPTTRHSVTFTQDLAEAMIRVAADPTAFGRAWHAPTAPAITQQAMVELAASIAGTEPRIQAVGPTMMRLAGLFSRGAREMVEMLYEFTDDFVVDSSAFEERFGQAATPLADAFAATIAALWEAGPDRSGARR